jgi:hypothetical protein
MKAIPQYAAIVRHYPTLKGPLQEVLAKEINFFREVRSEFVELGYSYLIVISLFWVGSFIAGRQFWPFNCGYKSRTALDTQESEQDIPQPFLTSSCLVYRFQQ